MSATQALDVDVDYFELGVQSGFCTRNAELIIKMPQRFTADVISGWRDIFRGGGE